MNRGKGSITHGRMDRQQGYTIVEVLIFLAVSAVLFGSTMALLAGKQQKAQFSNAVRDFETQIIDVANDVSNGYYQSSGNIACTAGNPPNVTVGSPQQTGTNSDCVLLGRIIKLGYGATPQDEKIGIYTLVGNRLSGLTDVDTLSAANPTLLWDDISSAASVRELRSIGYGASVRCVGINKDNCDENTENSSNAAIMFATRLNGSAKPGADGNSITADTYFLKNAAINQNEDSFVAGVQFANFEKLPGGQPLTICLQSGTTNQYALVKILNGSVTSVIKGGSLCD